MKQNTTNYSRSFISIEHFSRNVCLLQNNSRLAESPMSSSSVGAPRAPAEGIEQQYKVLDRKIVFPDEGATAPNNNERKSPLLSISPRRNSILIRSDPIQRDWVFRNSMMHYGSTLLIVMCCYFGATKVEGVAEIWSLIGSSLAFLIAFILPFGCFIVIENGVRDKIDRMGGSKLLRPCLFCLLLVLQCVLGIDLRV